MKEREEPFTVQHDGILTLIWVSCVPLNNAGRTPGLSRAQTLVLEFREVDTLEKMDKFNLA